MADGIEETRSTFEYLVRPGHAGLRELRREDRLAARFGAGKVLPIGKGANATLVDCGVPAHRDPYGVDDLFFTEPHQSTCADKARKPKNGRVIQAEAPDIQHIGDLAKDFVGQRGGDDKIAPAASRDLG